jgi:uncharacterized protein (DUF1684 family)
MPRMRATIERMGFVAALLFAAALPGGGCGSAERGLMVQIPPPRNWEAELIRYREAKDRQFKTSAESPLLPDDVAEFAGLDYWEPDPDLYFAGPIHSYREPQRVEVITTTGQQRPAEKYGYVRFRLGGRVQTIQVYRLLDQEPREGVDGLFVAFLDVTSGKETYPAGRYIDFLGEAGGPYVLDFNLAFNPSCAYGDPERFACPRAPEENRISVRIEAGERGYKEAAATAP